MLMLGTWTGALFIDKLKEYIEDEFFEIEILSIDAENAITAKIIEQVQTEDLFIDRMNGVTAYLAAGTLDPKSGRLLLTYKANSLNGEPGRVEITGIINEEYGTMVGQYRLLSQPEPQASFKLKKTEEEPL